MIVYNETEKVFKFKKMRNGMIIWTTALPGEGICAKTYPKEADSLKNHNRRFKVKDGNQLTRKSK